jgi:acyl-CoA thioester hydrolase
MRVRDARSAMTSRPHDSVLVHTTVQPIRWGDMDALGHVNNTVYFRYMEQARIEWLYSHAKEGGGYADGTGPVIANASCTFLEPLVYPGDCEIRMYLGSLGRTSVGSFYEIWKDGRKFAEGAAKIVWIDMRSGRSTPLPESIVAPLRAAAHSPRDGARAEGSR